MKSALKIATLYAVISLGWIVLTDRLVANFAPSREAETLYQTSKGFLFVLGSSVVIFGLLVVHNRRRMAVLVQLAAMRQSFEQLFEANPLPVIAYDQKSGAIFETNQAAIDLYGFTRDEFRQLAISVLHAERPAQSPATSKGEVEARSDWQRKKNGNLFAARLLEKSVTFDDQAARVAVVFDLTELIEAERAHGEAVEAKLLAEQAKTNFLSTISHELRTPLNAISGFTALLRGEDDPQIREEFLETIEDNAAEMLQLVDLLLAAASAHRTGIRLRPSAFSLPDMLETLRAYYEPTAQAKGITLAVHTDADLPVRVYLDELRLRQILQNLLSNAVKFSPEGTITLTASAAGKGPESHVSFRVSDEGPGIPSEQIGQIFQPFVQIDSGTTRQFAGPGVGLFICKQLVELMGGEIRVETAPGKGTVFTVELPLPDSTEEADRAVGEAKFF